MACGQKQLNSESCRGKKGGGGLPFFLQIFQIFVVTCDRKQPQKSEEKSKKLLAHMHTSDFSDFSDFWKTFSVCLCVRADVKKMYRESPRSSPAAPHDAAPHSQQWTSRAERDQATNISQGLLRSFEGQQNE